VSRIPPEAVRLMNGFRGYQLAVAACRLKLPDLVAAGHTHPDELSSLTGTDSGSLRRVLRGLAAWGFFAEDSSGAYRATPVSEAFRSDQPGLRNMAMMLSKEGYASWAELMYTIETGEPVFERIYGKSRWEKMAEDPEDAALFNAAMVTTSKRVGKEFAAAYDFEGVRVAVDVAGGNGALLAAVLHRLPTARGILFDLPSGIAGARQLVEDAGVADRVTTVEGSFFESVPAGGDLYMLKSIIHDWDDEHAVQILSTCRRAMHPAARLVLVERLMPARIDSTGDYLGTVMSDLHMMVVLGGRERTTPEYEALLTAAGLSFTREVPMESDFYAVEARPA
jgi:orsellinic acid C2-O-methyltransferase